MKFPKGGVVRIDTAVIEEAVRTGEWRKQRYGEAGALIRRLPRLIRAAAEGGASCIAIRVDDETAGKVLRYFGPDLADTSLRIRTDSDITSAILWVEW